MSIVDLVEFLRERLDEDEAAARAAATVDHGARRGVLVEPFWDATFTNDYEGGLAVAAYTTGDELSQEIAQPLGSLTERDAMCLHIARHDPARVLAEVETKRLIVEMCNDRLWCHDHYGPDVGSEYTLRLLAQPYAGHPDWREEWRVKPSDIR